MVREVVESTRTKMFRKYIRSVKKILNSTDPSDGFKFQIIALKVMGIFKCSSANVFVKFLAIFPSLLVIKLCALGLVFLLQKDVSLADKLQGSFTGNTSLLCVIKLLIMRKNQPKLIRAVEQLKSRVNNMTEMETKTLYQEAIYPAAASYLMLQSLCIFCSIFFGFFPLNRHNYNKPLPVYGWYPQFVMISTGDIFYYIAYFLQELSIVCSSSLWVAIDTINFGLLAHHYVMLKILGGRIASLGWNEKNKGISGHADDYAKLCECVKYHIQISSYQNESNEIYSDILFAKVTMSVIIICSFVYSLTMDLGSLGGFVAEFGILVVILSTLFVISWMSEKISETSAELLNRAAECNFVDMDGRTRKTLVMFMQGALNTMHIEVGSIFKIRLNCRMFVTIIEFAYKCLALLKTAV